MHRRLLGASAGSLLRGVGLISCAAFAACGVEGPESQPDSVAEAAEALTSECIDPLSGTKYTYTSPWDAPVLKVSSVAVTATDRQRAERSLLVTNHLGLSALPKSVAVGDPALGVASLLRNLGDYTTWKACVDARLDGHRTLAEDYSRSPFRAAALDVEQNDAYTDGPKIGETRDIKYSWRDVLSAWQDGSLGPFRLLAVVNRGDLAGDTDARAGGNLAATERRWMGEGRLVFGTTVTTDGTTVIPLTVILEYRLPALKPLDSGGTFHIAVDPAFNWTTGPLTDDSWKDQRMYWAKVWNELSRNDPSTTEYQALLKKIVMVFAQPENFLAMRTGENVRKPSGEVSGEFEYREFYLSAAYNLTSRKVRREPMLCEDNTQTLQNHINAEWNPAASDFHFDFAPGDRTLNKVEQKEIIGVDGGQLGKCSNDAGHIPFGQGQFNDLQFRANYIRFKPQTTLVPTPAWQNSYDPDETKRHAFAARTCSGCHATETGAGGFLIQPRNSDDVDAQLDGILSYDLQPRQVTVNDHTYGNAFLKDRLDLMNSFLTRATFNYGAVHTFQNEMLYCSPVNGGGCASTPR
jgi:hypothetical protein